MSDAFDEDVAIETIAHWVDLFSGAMTPEASRAAWRQFACDYVRQGVVELKDAILAARSGHEDMDKALRELVAEGIHAGNVPEELRDFACEALFRPLSTYGRGRRVVDGFLWTIGVKVLVSAAMDRWQLDKTRNEATFDWPSASSLVSQALNLRGYKISEKHVEKLAVNSDRTADRVSASIQRKGADQKAT